jgi:hypothetical protein
MPNKVVPLIYFLAPVEMHSVFFQLSFLVRCAGIEGYPGAVGVCIPERDRHLATH